MKNKLWIFTLTAAAIFAGNSFLLIKKEIMLLLPVIFLVLAVNLLPSLFSDPIMTFRMKVCLHGSRLLNIFWMYLISSLAVHIVLAFKLLPDDWKTLVFSMLVCFGVGFVIFWNGMIAVYLTSVQLRVRERVIGLAVGMIPVLNIIMLLRIIRITKRELEFETAKLHLNRERKDKKVCGCKYPILLVHGVFFRDFKLLNYWGRIPAELEANGARVFYGKQQSALSVAESARELAENINKITAETGCGKLNIIAHSKGGLDCRYALQNLGIHEKVASLTTVNTPHRGAKVADYLLTKAPDSLLNKVADKYNGIFKALGDREPDFVSAVRDLTSEKCREFNENVRDTHGVFCRSVGSIQKRAFGGRFPLNMTYAFVNMFEGENDGLVGVESFPWGEEFILKKAPASRGISHGDMIDLNRENIDGFDVREFYVDLVADLKNRGF